MTTTVSSSVPVLLNRLIEQFIPSSTKENENTHQSNKRQKLALFMRLLGSRLTPSIVPDEFQIFQQIQKTLIKETNSAQKIEQANLLLQRLKKKGNLNLWPILYVIYSVSESKKKKTFQPSFGIDQSFTLSSIPKESDNPFKNQKILSTVDSVKEIPNSQKKESTIEIFNSKQNVIKDETLEKLLLTDVLFTLQGIDGKFIQYNKNQDTYLIDPKLEVSHEKRDLVYKITELGWLYRKIQTSLQKSTVSFVESLVFQSFISALKEQLTDYYRLVSVVQSQFNDSTSNLTLRRLLVWIQDPLRKLRIIAQLIDSTSSQKGGVFLSILESFTNHGDPFISKFVRNIMTLSCEPLFSMIRSWALEGDLMDPFAEFFVFCNIDTSNERLWFEKYTLNEKMIPSFFSKNLANKIFLMGKSINFLRECCKDIKWLVEHLKWKPKLEEVGYGQIDSLEGVLQEAAIEVNKRLLHVILEDYKLLDHCLALKKFLLLGQGDFVQQLLDRLGEYLSKPVTSVHRYNLISVLEGAIRGSNAQYTEQSILNNLDVNISSSPNSNTSLGWDIFSLDYKVQVPLNTVLTPESISLYIKLFMFLFKMKRVEFSLSSTWKLHFGRGQRAFSHHSAPQLVERQEWNTLRNEMMHFLNNFQYYITFEVLECTWDDLVQEIHQAKDLDELIRAHSKFTETLMKKLLLTSQDFGKIINKSLNLIQQFCQMHERLISGAGTSDNEDQSEAISFVRLSTQESTKVTNELITISSEYRNSMIELVRFISTQSTFHNENLQFLKTRLDFSDFYDQLTKNMKKT